MRKSEHASSQSNVREPATNLLTEYASVEPCSRLTKLPGYQSFTYLCLAYSWEWIPKSF